MLLQDKGLVPAFVFSRLRPPTWDPILVEDKPSGLVPAIVFSRLRPRTWDPILVEDKPSVLSWPL